MSDNNKRYFWLKLKDSFFRDKRIKKLRRIAGGDTFTIIYLKLQLLSIRNNGVLVYEGIEDTFAEELALELDEDIDNVNVTLAFLTNNGMIEETEPDHFLMTETVKCIGSEGASAERVRRHRELTEKKKEMLHSNTNVTMCNTEKDIDKDIEKDKDNKYIAEQVLFYLNEKANKRFKAIPTNLKFILGRLKDYSEDDLKAVIDKKVAEWKGTEMETYLRPETLFNATKFECYVNAPLNKPNRVGYDNSQHFECERKYEKSDIDYLMDNIDDIEF